MRKMIGPIAYGATFTLLAPTLLWWWAHASAYAVHVPALRCPVIGAICLLIGLLLISFGMLSLWRNGGGLPMNAYPPPRFVQIGVYGWIAHPIYVGFVFACLGSSVWS